jgi:pimeloyl-ACP methyl ester carboxylesterase
LKPVIFNGCFGWLHTNREDVGSDVAVLMCHGLHRDALDAYHSFRLLADEFAAAGYPAMRFDYPGTGDSCDAGDAEHWAAWQQSVHAAADWLCRHTGAQRLIFFGLRFGATLATVAAESRSDVAGLILLEPVVRGRSYMQQLLIQAELLSGSRPKTGEDLSLYELHLTAETVSLIRRVDLQQAKLGVGHHVMILSRSMPAPLTNCVRAWSDRDAEVVCTDVHGLEPMLDFNLRYEGAPADFSQVIEWVRRSVPARPIPRPSVSFPEHINLRLAGCTESPLRFGPEERLFGVLCRPDRPAGDRAVIICNTGRDPHHGFARFGVEFARRLAAEGIASVRIDFAGLGDSLGPPGQETVMSPVFAADRSPDIMAAIDALERMGYQRFAVHGVCAGAYHAFHAALADVRINALLLINMSEFTWREGDTIDFLRRKTTPASHFLFRLADMEIWTRLVKGKLDVAAAVRAQYERQHERLRQGWLRLVERLAHTGPQSFPRRAMGILSRRRTRTLFLFAPGDGSIGVLEREFGRGGAGLRTFDGAEMHIVPGLDHNLSSVAMRQTASDLMVDFLAEAPAAAISKVNWTFRVSDEGAMSLDGSV